MEGEPPHVATTGYQAFRSPQRQSTNCTAANNHSFRRLGFRFGWMGYEGFR
ncbi:hypothetical protein Hanom_Chr12g01132351 [Helianthus anomalus]